VAAIYVSAGARACAPDAAQTRRARTRVSLLAAGQARFVTSGSPGQNGVRRPPRTLRSCFAAAIMGLLNHRRGASRIVPKLVAASRRSNKPGVARGPSSPPAITRESALLSFGADRPAAVIKRAHGRLISVGLLHERDWFYMRRMGPCIPTSGNSQ
jgi:hypothetical protein